MNIYKMKLGEHFWSSEMDCNILRIPGGWVLRNYDHETGENIISQVFVPFNNEFMENTEPVEPAQQHLTQQGSEPSEITPVEESKQWTHTQAMNANDNEGY